ncbi:hypothetical protein AQUCO_10800050v1 [Aquilegia coerulea]|uniref:Uncharacterized protein n=1 Tax=Aquilegia coerulea TaxID=218851 RepID=A0A2G5C3F8_AQUCA|nr:hypothetical protein AQUCO_10800050v1 [Aquilegia coerulea]
MINTTDFASPSSSPPTPPSPLPISVGPGYDNHASPQTIPILLQQKYLPMEEEPSTFSLDQTYSANQLRSQTSCLKELLVWLLIRCCHCSQSL